MQINTKNMIWGAIALLFLAGFLYKNQLPQRQQAQSPPQQQAPGAIRWNP